MTQNRGVIYVAFRFGRYYHQAIRSARSVRKHNPGLKISIMTDSEEEPNPATEGLFDQVMRYDPPPNNLAMQSKIDVLRASPYEHTLFMDADTCACGDIEPMFGVLEAYDFAVTASLRMFNPRWEPSEVPYWFPEPLIGVALVRKTKAVDRLLNQWEKLYDKLGERQAQRSGRIVLYRAIQDGLKLYWLPLNCHAWAGKIGGHNNHLMLLGGKIRIVHGSGPGMDLAKLCGEIDKNTRPRAYRVGHGFV